MTDRLIGMLGPAAPREFGDLLPPAAAGQDLPLGIGGTPVVLLTKELVRRGHRVVLATLDRSVREEVVLRGDRLTVCVLPWRQAHAARDFFRQERRALAAMIERERPAILHAQWTYEYALAAQASGLPTVITAHDAPWNVLRHNFIPYRIARTAMAYRVLSRAPRVVSVAPYVARHLKRWMLYRGAPTVVPNGMPSALFDRPQRRCEAATPVVFAAILVGWSGRKNSEALLEAFALVRRSVPSARLVLFGAGHGRQEPAATWASQRGIADGVEFVGQIAHAALLERLSTSVDVLVHPALEEAQPMALIEALALRIPVIAGERSGGVPWTLDEGRAGILVDVTRPAEIAAWMKRLAEDPAERASWGERGRVFAERRFHIHAVADAFEAVYRTL